MAAKSGSTLEAGRTGSFMWKTSGTGSKGKQFERLIITMADAKVHTVQGNDLLEGLAGYEPLFKMGFSLKINTEEEGGESF